MKVLYFESLDSTNSYLKEHEAEYENFTFVRAGYQSLGKGRSGRTWNSNKQENLLFSILLKDKDLLDHYATISILAAYSVLEVLEDLGIKGCKIKWPNDLYIQDQKVAGILLEGISKQSLECLIVGIGININQKEFIGEYLRKPTSLALELKQTFDLRDLETKIYQSIEKNFRDLKKGKDFYEEIVSYDYLRGKKGFASIQNKTKEVEILGMNVDYSLKVRVEGETLDLRSGEISFHI